MAGVLEQLDDEQHAQPDIAAAWQRWAELLHREVTDAALDDDGELLLELCRQLGLGIDDFRDHAGNVVPGLSTMYARAADEQHRRAECKRLSEKLRRYRARAPTAGTDRAGHIRAREKVRKIQSELTMNQHRLGVAVRARESLERLRTKHPWLADYEKLNGQAPIDVGGVGDTS